LESGRKKGIIAGNEESPMVAKETWTENLSAFLFSQKRTTALVLLFSMSGGVLVLVTFSFPRTARGNRLYDNIISALSMFFYESIGTSLVNSFNFNPYWVLGIIVMGLQAALVLLVLILTLIGIGCLSISLYIVLWKISLPFLENQDTASSQTSAILGILLTFLPGAILTNLVVVDSLPSTLSWLSSVSTTLLQYGLILLPSFLLQPLTNPFSGTMDLVTDFLIFLGDFCLILILLFFARHIRHHDILRNNTGLEIGVEE
jgi:hypothetical protein